ncbi:SHOCT domain-containing protein [Carnobacterium divergens]|uniref:SHOCT domain-containing protein n=1 Tax=Carnobacterium divergens TaxID=2748 RepID=UPI0039AE988A
MVDWKDLAKKSLNKSVELTKKGVEAGIDWKNDPERIAKVQQQKAEKAISKVKAKPFNADKIVGKLFYVDTEKQQFKVGGYRNAANVFDFNQVSSYELVESDHTITSGGLGRSAVGAVAFGSVGAVVGALTGGKKTKKVVENFKIKINLKSIETPVVYVELLISKTKTNSLIYKDALEKADNILSILDYYSIQKENINTTVGDDELLKFKKYLDEGIITQAEFDAKKRELLNL